MDCSGQPLLTVDVTIDGNHVAVNGLALELHPGLDARETALRSVALRIVAITGRAVAVNLREPVGISQVVVHPGGQVTAEGSAAPLPAAVPVVPALTHRRRLPRRTGRVLVGAAMVSLVASAGGWALMRQPVAEPVTSTAPAVTSVTGSAVVDGVHLEPAAFIVAEAPRLERTAQQLDVHPVAQVGAMVLHLEVEWGPVVAIVDVLDAGGVQHHLRVPVRTTTATVRVGDLPAGAATWGVAVGRRSDHGLVDIPGKVVVSTGVPAAAAPPEPSEPSAPSAPSQIPAPPVPASGGGSAPDQGDSEDNIDTSDIPDSPVGVHDSPGGRP